MSYYFYHFLPGLLSEIITTIQGALEEMNGFTDLPQYPDLFQRL